MLGPASTPRGEIRYDFIRRERAAQPVTTGLEFGSAPAHHAHEQRDDEQDEENIKQDLRDTRGGTRDASETQKASDEGNNKENQSIMEHCDLD